MLDNYFDKASNAQQLICCSCPPFPWVNSNEISASLPLRSPFSLVDLPLVFLNCFSLFPVLPHFSCHHMKALMKRRIFHILKLGGSTATLISCGRMFMQSSKSHSWSGSSSPGQYQKCIPRQNGICSAKLPSEKHYPKRRSIIKW